ncbi:MAG TPA: DNA primase [Candidatus Anaerobiospirillum pullistercoris]|uniref:DNA primase n=1 Tax=Candidatus Anaerobiospirillum pullistercoris TaxID=2838452 RepID=A0A9D1WF04_9GAMM|nr:DNA primase [Candidatus Anaerobiospirillum pullistercoris]
MARIAHDFIKNKLMPRLDIVRVIQRFCNLKQSGRNYSCKCPFHQEKTPSFIVSPSRQRFKCFGCGAHGSAIDFVMEYKKCTFVEAIEDLAHFAGIDVEYESNEASLAYERFMERNKASYELLERATLFFMEQLKANPQVMDYCLKNRQMSEEMILKARLGYAPNDYSYVKSKLCQSQEEFERYVELGLISVKTNDNGMSRDFSFFRDRLMIPLFDLKGRVIAFGARRLTENEEVPKYINSTESPIFKKKRELFGLYECLQASHNRPEEIVVVEGYMDALLLRQAGYTNAVAALGTALTFDHVNTLYRYTKKVVLCFDGDRAGGEATWKALQVSLPALDPNRNMGVAILPPKVDPDAFVREKGLLAFENLVGKPINYDEAIFSYLAHRYDIADPAQQVGFLKEALSIVHAMPYSVMQAVSLRLLQKVLGNNFTLDTLREIMDQTEPNRDFLPKEDNKYGKAYEPANRYGSQKRAGEVNAKRFDHDEYPRSQQQFPRQFQGGMASPNRNFGQGSYPSSAPASASANAPANAPAAAPVYRGAPAQERMPQLPEQYEMQSPYGQQGQYGQAGQAGQTGQAFGMPQQPNDALEPPMDYAQEAPDYAMQPAQGFSPQRSATNGGRNYNQGYQRQQGAQRSQFQPMGNFVPDPAGQIGPAGPAGQMPWGNMPFMPQAFGFGNGYNMSPEQMQQMQFQQMQQFLQMQQMQQMQWFMQMQMQLQNSTSRALPRANSPYVNGYGQQSYQPRQYGGNYYNGRYNGNNGGYNRQQRPYQQQPFYGGFNQNRVYTADPSEDFLPTGAPSWAYSGNDEFGSTRISPDAESYFAVGQNPLLPASAQTVEEPAAEQSAGQSVGRDLLSSGTTMSASSLSVGADETSVEAGARVGALPPLVQKPATGEISVDELKERAYQERIQRQMESPAGDYMQLGPDGSPTARAAAHNESDENAGEYYAGGYGPGFSPSKQQPAQSESKTKSEVLDTMGVVGGVYAGQSQLVAKDSSAPLTQEELSRYQTVVGRMFSVRELSGVEYKLIAFILQHPNIVSFYYDRLHLDDFLYFARELRMREFPCIERLLRLICADRNTTCGSIIEEYRGSMFEPLFNYLGDQQVCISHELGGEMPMPGKAEIFVKMIMEAMQKPLKVMSELRHFSKGDKVNLQLSSALKGLATRTFANSSNSNSSSVKQAFNAEVKVVANGSLMSVEEAAAAKAAAAAAAAADAATAPATADAAAPAADSATEAADTAAADSAAAADTVTPAPAPAAPTATEATATTVNADAVTTAEPIAASVTDQPEAPVSGGSSSAAVTAPAPAPAPVPEVAPVTPAVSAKPVVAVEPRAETATTVESAAPAPDPAPVAVPEITPVSPEVSPEPVGVTATTATTATTNSLETTAKDAEPVAASEEVTAEAIPATVTTATEVSTTAEMHSESDETNAVSVDSEARGAEAVPAEVATAATDTLAAEGTTTTITEAKPVEAVDTVESHTAIGADAEADSGAKVEAEKDESLGTDAKDTIAAAEATEDEQVSAAKADVVAVAATAAVTSTATTSTTTEEHSESVESHEAVAEVAEDSASAAKAEGVVNVAIEATATTEATATEATATATEDALTSSADELVSAEGNTTNTAEASTATVTTITTEEQSEAVEGAETAKSSVEPVEANVATANTANAADTDVPEQVVGSSESGVIPTQDESAKDNDEPSHGDAVIAPEPTMNPLGTLAVISLASSKPVDGDFADAVFDADIDLDLGSINPLEAKDPKAEAEQALGLGKAEVEAEAGTESELSAEPALEDKTIAAEADADAKAETIESKNSEPATEVTKEVSATVAATAETVEVEVTAVAEATTEPALEDKALAAKADTDAEVETTETKVSESATEAEPTENTEEVSATATAETVEVEVAGVAEATAEPTLEDKTLAAEADTDAKAETTEAKDSESATEAEPTENTEKVSATTETVEVEVAGVAEATAEPALEDKALESDAKADADSKTKSKSKAEQQESEPVEGSLMAAFGDDFDAILAPEHHEDKPHKKPKSKSKKSASAKKAAKAQESSDELGSQGSLGEGQLL